MSRKKKAVIQKVEEVNHPSHYVATMEHVDIVEDFGLDYFAGNATKYIFRAGKKPGVAAITDYRKAIWYLQRKIDFLERGPDVWRVRSKDPVAD